MIKNIIFDLAGVVMNLNLERDEKALRAVGLPNFYDFPNYPEICGPTMEYLNGLTSEESFLERIRPCCKVGATDDEIMWAMNAVLDEIPLARIEKIVELKKRYNVYLLSNIYDTAWEHAVNEITSKGYAVEDLFHKTFLSYEMQLAKPDPRIFQSVIDSTGILPEETVYFDDSRENIKAGQVIGLDSRLVKINFLEELLEGL